jgi:2-hydroxy-3-keto-5-methylthiopentenyl-1-phosphate phosphatase
VHEQHGQAPRAQDPAASGVRRRAEPGSARREPPPARDARVLVVDFDGTVTETDLLDTIAQTFGDPEVYREVDEGLDESRLTLREVIRREFEPVRSPLADVQDWALENVRIRPGFRELVALARERGWRVIIVSSGFHELIEPILEREGVEVELHANRVDPDPGGWRVLWQYDEDCDVCGESCKRSVVRKLAGEDEIVYVGDGYSDRCAAEDSDRVFATRGLARYLDERGVPFERFDDFHQIARSLDGFEPVARG